MCCCMRHNYHMSHIHTIPTPRPAFSRTFYLALLTTLLYAFSITLLLPLVALYITDELNQADHWIGTATVAVTITAVSIRIPSGTLSDTHGRRKLMLIGGGLSMISGVLYIFSVNLPLFLLARLMNGAGLGMFTSANKALVADLAPPERRGEALGLSNTGFMAAIIFSPLLSEVLMNTFGFQAVFVANLILSIICFAVTFTLPQVLPPPQQHSVRQNIRIVLNERGTWAANLMMFGMGTGLAMMFTFYPLLAERKDLFADAPRAISTVAMGLGLSIWALTDSVIEPIAGWFSDRFGRQIVAAPGLIGATIGIAMLSRAHDTYSTYVAIAILAAGWGMARAIADSLSQDAVAPALRGIGAAILYTSFDSAVGINAQLLGSLIDGSNFDLFFTVAAVILLVFSIPGLLLASGLRSYEQRIVAEPTGD